MQKTRQNKFALALVTFLGLGFALLLANQSNAQGPAGTNGGGTTINALAFEVAATDPVTNEVGVALTHTISLTYNQAISATTVNSGTIVAQGMMGGLLTGTYSVEGAQVTLTPSRPLFPNEIVRTTVTSGTENLGAVAAEPFQWQFTAGEVVSRCLAGFSRQSTGSAGTPTGVDHASVAWGDYDSDGDLDILLAGDSGSFVYVTEVWRNDGAGAFGQETIGPAGSLTGVSYNASVAWGDYDNDGDLDILLAGYTGGAYVTEVWRNDGAMVGGWAFSQQSTAPTGVYNGSVAWGDYDNDGDLDILLAGWDSSTQVTEVWRNDGGVFVLQSNAPTGVEYNSVAWGDYDNDGDLDILLAGYTGSTRVTEVWRNDSGVFVSHSTAPTGVSGGSVAWGDYDNDGDLDILLAGWNGSTRVTEVWRNDSGVFTLQSIAGTLTSVNNGSVAWGDYDNDGDLDILLAGHTGSSNVTEVWRNDGAIVGGWAFSQQSTAPTGVNHSSAAWGDYDKDGDLDILLAGDSGSSVYVTEVWRNDDCPAVTATDPSANEVAVPLTHTINLTYSQVISATTVNTGTIAAQGSMGGLLTGTYSVDGARVTLTPSRPLFPNEIVRTTATSGTESLGGNAAAPYQWQFTAGEVADRCIAGFGRQSTGPEGTPTGVDYASVAWGDYDRDGDLDILLAGDNGSGGASGYVTEIWRNDGGGSFGQQPATPTGVFRGSVAWGDYDGDGDLDILLSGWSGSDYVTEVWRNDGGGAFSQQPTGPVGTPTGVWLGDVAWGDYDNDGDLDILLSGYDGSARVTEVWRNDGGGTFDQQPTALTGVRHSSVAWGDYDQDGDLDILLSGDVDSGRVTQVWRNDGAAGGGWAFSLQPASLTGVRYGSVAWGDYDRDGDLDILLSGESGPSVYVTEVWRNDGGGSFSQQSTAPTGLTNGSVSWGDYDNDGDLDILLAGATGSASVTEVWRNDGATVAGWAFSQQSVGPEGTPTGVDHASATWGDHDGDGDLDILLSGESGPSVYVTEVWRNDDCAVADAGPEQAVSVAAVVTLDGSASADPNGGPLSYGWTQTGGPAVSFSPGLSRTTFAAPAAPAVLGFRLTVTTGHGYSATDSTVVTVTALPPSVPTYTLSLNIVGEGSAAATPEQAAYEEGSVVTLTAAANAGSIFAGWSGDLMGATTPITLTMDGDKVVTATFDLREIDLREPTGYEVYLPFIARP